LEKNFFVRKHSSSLGSPPRYSRWRSASRSVQWCRGAPFSRSTAAENPPVAKGLKMQLFDKVIVKHILEKDHLLMWDLSPYISA